MEGAAGELIVSYSIQRYIPTRFYCSTLHQILFNVLHFIIIFFKLKSLEQKDEAEEEAKLVLRAQAKQELDDWYKQHAEQVKE